MSYSKQVLILKEHLKGYSISGKSLSGICRIEVENGVSTIYLSLINFASVISGEFYLKIIDGKNSLYSFPLGKNPFSTTFVYEKAVDLSSVFCVVVYQNKEVLPICYAKLNTTLSLDSFCDRVFEELLPSGVAPLEVYDDEIIATENYYLTEEAENLKIKENLVEDIEKEVYYDKVKDELEDLFKKYPLEEGLKKAIPNGEFIKIYYNEEKYYTVGLIKEFDKPKYICYGVPARYSVTPPKELAGFCSFLPLSLLNLKGDGFWMIYQDAITGDCVKINE
ncbi:MAG: hypothetical protein IKC71_04100 [Clostridia bacterium]|nr:hypothetical protein [Clostridia bacterium]